jgi:choline-sulfatase
MSVAPLLLSVTLVTSAALLARAIQDPEVGTQTPPAADMQPDAPYDRVLLVSIDTARRDRFGFHGGTARTPNLDRLALEGVVCERAHAPTPVTLPSHTSLFTGLYPPRHGVRDNTRFRLGAEAETLAERFAAAGFRTAAFVSAFVLDAQFGLAQGFEVYDDRFQSGLGGMPGREERTATATTEMALRWLNARGDGKWFVFLHYFDPHHPYEAPKQHAPEGVHPYDAELAHVDTELGRVLEHLCTHDLMERTLVVVTADHGESLGEHGEATHGIFVYQSTLAIPLVFHGSGLSAGTRVALPVSLVDVAPTLLQLTGLAPLPDAHGQSIAGELRGQPLAEDDAAPPPRALYAEAFTNSHTFGWSPLVALIQGDQKYILAPRPELYDLRADPRESKDLAATAPTAATALRTQLERWYGELAGDAASKPGIDVELTDEERARLGALGYASAGGKARAQGAGRDPKDALAEFDLMQRAGAAHDAGRLEEALALYERILEQNPRNSMVLERSGMALIGLKRTKEGVERLESLDLFPGSSMFALAQAYATLGDAERTLELVRELRERNPKFMPAHLFFAQLCEGTGDRAGAIAAYERLLANWHGDVAFRRQIEQRIDALRNE